VHQFRAAKPNTGHSPHVTNGLDNNNQGFYLTRRVPDLQLDGRLLRQLHDLPLVVDTDRGRVVVGWVLALHESSQQRTLAHGRIADQEDLVWTPELNLNQIWGRKYIQQNNDFWT